MLCCRLGCVQAFPCLPMSLSLSSSHVLGAHGLQLHPTKTNIISNTTSKRGRGNTVAGQGLNTEILRPEGKIKYLGQLTTFKNAVQVEFEYRIKYAWATVNSHRQELTSPKYPLRGRLKLFGATVNPIYLYAAGMWTMTEEVKKLQTTQRRMMRMIILTSRARHERRRYRRRTPRLRQRAGGRHDCTQPQRARRKQPRRK